MSEFTDFNLTTKQSHGTIIEQCTRLQKINMLTTADICGTRTTAFVGSFLFYVNYMKKDINEFIGKKFFHATVIGLDKTYNHPNCNRWIFMCDCGNEFSARASDVIHGSIRSCGCKTKGKHGYSRDEFYPTWDAMMSRCYNKKCKKYPLYGGRGILVCSEWHEPENFILWARKTIGQKINELSIDRIDVNGNYEPSNCRWVTMKQQCRNRRRTRFESIDGVLRPFTEWCEIYNIEENVVRNRCDCLGWDFEKALKTPVKNHKKNIISEKSIKMLYFITINGETKELSEWCNIYNIRRNTVIKRLKRGWNILSAIKTPLNEKKMCFSDSFYVRSEIK